MSGAARLPALLQVRCLGLLESYRTQFGKSMSVLSNIIKMRRIHIIKLQNYSQSYVCVTGGLTGGPTEGQTAGQSDPFVFPFLRKGDTKSSTICTQFKY